MVDVPYDCCVREVRGKNANNARLDSYGGAVNPVRQRRGFRFIQSGSLQITLGFVQPGHLLQTYRRSVGRVPHVDVGTPCQPFSLVPFISATVCTADQRKKLHLAVASVGLRRNYNNSLASRRIHTNSKQCSPSARCVRLLYSRGCARTLTDD